MAYLNIENFHKSFGNNHVLKGIDLQLNKGEVVSIIGSSGSGKTTLLRCINFLEFSDQGKMTLENEVLFDADSNEKDSDAILREKRLNFGLVFQSFNLFPQYNVLENITLAPKLRFQLNEKKMSHEDKKIAMEEIEATAKALLKTIGMTEKATAYPCELSGGQQQRVAIARALALSPDILCFDEPTSALDPELTGEVLRVIRDLKTKGCTMIVVTHEMEFAKNVSDEVIFMANGVSEEQGSPEEIFDHPKSPLTQSFLNKSLESF